MQLLEYFGVLTGLLYLFLEIRQHRGQCGVVGFLTSLVYVFVFFFSKIYADMGLNIYYVAISIYGFWQWTRRREVETAQNGEAAPSQEAILYRNMTPSFSPGSVPPSSPCSRCSITSCIISPIRRYRQAMLLPLPSESSPPGCWPAGSSSTGYSGSSSTACPSIFITCVVSIPQCFSIFATPFWRQSDYILGKRKE